MLPAHLNISNHALCYLKITLTVFTPLRSSSVYTDKHIHMNVYKQTRKTFATSANARETFDNMLPYKYNCANDYCVCPLWRLRCLQTYVFYVHRYVCKALVYLVALEYFFMVSCLQTNLAWTKLWIKTTCCHLVTFSDQLKNLGYHLDNFGRAAPFLRQPKSKNGIHH